MSKTAENTGPCYGVTNYGMNEIPHTVDREQFIERVFKGLSRVRRRLYTYNRVHRRFQRKVEHPLQFQDVRLERERKQFSQLCLTPWWDKAEQNLASTTESVGIILALLVVMGPIIMRILSVKLQIHKGMLIIEVTSLTKDKGQIITSENIIVAWSSVCKKILRKARTFIKRSVCQRMSSFYNPVCCSGIAYMFYFGCNKLLE